MSELIPQEKVSLEQLEDVITWEPNKNPLLTAHLASILSQSVMPRKDMAVLLQGQLNRNISLK